MFACNYRGCMDANLKPIHELQLRIPKAKKISDVQHLDNTVHKFNLILCSRLNNVGNVKELLMTRESVHDKLSNVKADYKTL